MLPLALLFVFLKNLLVIYLTGNTQKNLVDDVSLRSKHSSYFHYTLLHIFLLKDDFKIIFQEYFDEEDDDDDEAEKDKVSCRHFVCFHFLFVMILKARLDVNIVFVV